jgi:4-diphosphocytidyl-2-C-methyl-D-erythritol kinase
MIVFPIAKINLGLFITSKRPDGYHNIETLFYPVMLCDALELVVSEKQNGRDHLVTTGFGMEDDTGENLVLKTTRKLRDRHFFPYLNLHLHKAIPIGAGLGGGSSDAACLLRAINRSFGLELPKEELKNISLEIGSDCPFFISGIPSIATGRGELLQTVKPVLSGYYLILLNPGVGINTREAYQNCRPHTHPSPLEQLVNKPINEWKDLIINGFEDYAFKKHPVIGEIKNALYDTGALFSLMSGSGSSVYGIFRKKPELPDKLKPFVIYEGSV